MEVGWGVGWSGVDIQEKFCVCARADETDREARWIRTAATPIITRNLGENYSIDSLSHRCLYNTKQLDFLNAMVVNGGWGRMGVCSDG